MLEITAVTIGINLLTGLQEPSMGLDNYMDSQWKKTSPQIIFSKKRFRRLSYGQFILPATNR